MTIFAKCWVLIPVLCKEVCPSMLIAQVTLNFPPEVRSPQGGEYPKIVLLVDLRTVLARPQFLHSFPHLLAWRSSSLYHGIHKEREGWKYGGTLAAGSTPLCHTSTLFPPSFWNPGSRKKRSTRGEHSCQLVIQGNHLL